MQHIPCSNTAQNPPPQPGLCLITLHFLSRAAGLSKQCLGESSPQACSQEEEPQQGMPSMHSARMQGAVTQGTPLLAAA